MQAHLPEAPENVQSGNQVSLAFKITSDWLRRWCMLNYQSRSVSTGNRAGRSKASRNIFIIYFSRDNFEILLYTLFSLSLLIVSWFTFFVLGFFSTFHPALFKHVLVSFLFLYCYILLLLCMNFMEESFIAGDHPDSTKGCGGTRCAELRIWLGGSTCMDWEKVSHLNMWKILQIVFIDSLNILAKYYAIYPHHFNTSSHMWVRTEENYHQKINSNQTWEFLVRSWVWGYWKESFQINFAHP